LAQVAAARLIAHETRSGSAGRNAVQQRASALEGAARELSHWVGPDGCSALFTRALNRARQEYPVLRNIVVITESVPVLTGVEESVAASDADAVAVGLNATLVELFGLLVRVVGSDMTMKLAEQMTAGKTTDAVPAQDEEAEL
jgi:hypothetical protein